MVHIKNINMSQVNLSTEQKQTQTEQTCGVEGGEVGWTGSLQLADINCYIEDEHTASFRCRAWGTMFNIL